MSFANSGSVKPSFISYQYLSGPIDQPAGRVRFAKPAATSKPWRKTLTRGVWCKSEDRKAQPMTLVVSSLKTEKVGSKKGLLGSSVETSTGLPANISVSCLG